MESWRFEYSDKNIFFQTINTGFIQKEINFENEIMVSNQLAIFTSSAIRTLGWSNYSFGHWLNAFKVYLKFFFIIIIFLNLNFI